MKTLIAYFSRKGDNYVGGKIVNLPVGNTEVAAKKIAELTGGDLFAIKTAHVYAEDYTTCTEEAKAELQANARPELADAVPDLSAYDVIYLGYPNWWGTAPTDRDQNDHNSQNDEHEGQRVHQPAALDAAWRVLHLRCLRLRRRFRFAFLLAICHRK